MPGGCWPAGHDPQILRHGTLLRDVSVQPNALPTGDAHPTERGPGERTTGAGSPALCHELDGLRSGGQRVVSSDQVRRPDAQVVLDAPVRLLGRADAGEIYFISTGDVRTVFAWRRPACEVAFVAGSSGCARRVPTLVCPACRRSSTTVGRMPQLGGCAEAAARPASAASSRLMPGGFEPTRPDSFQSTGNKGVLLVPVAVHIL